MAHDIDSILLRPGDAVTFKDRDDLLETLDRLERRVPARHEGRTKVHREHFCMLRYLRFMAGEELLHLPATLSKPSEGQDPPDFLLKWPDGRRETFELTDGSTEEFQKRLSAESKAEDRLVLPVDINTPDREAAQLWAEILFSAFLKKAEGLLRGRFKLDHLLIYDLTGLGLLLPLERGAPILREKLREWSARERPVHRFGRISVLRDQALLLDLEHGGHILRRESPYYQLPVIRASDEEDLSRRLREIDRFCRENSIRHLKLFGSILGDRENDFREDSDLDILVEFEPGARVTLLDMARMERELGELLGFKVDLRTAGDLSRYFRSEVLEEAVELHASRG
ncbi:MAG TPA: nucleotidyltransferase family protein [Thermoanaerobaculia bacterium]|nr:nucleotidyltransferase family protein [Thermoanaerobaculia bacterium]